MRQMSKPRHANQSGIEASGSPGICRSKPCDPMEEPCTSRIVALGGPETERFSAMNSFLPFDCVQCSWPGTERVVMVAVMASPILFLGRRRRRLSLLNLLYLARAGAAREAKCPCPWVGIPDSEGRKPPRSGGR